jgi:hypothetical protein
LGSVPGRMCDPERNGPGDRLAGPVVAPSLFDETDDSRFGLIRFKAIMVFFA